MALAASLDIRPPSALLAGGSSRTGARAPTAPAPIAAHALPPRRSSLASSASQCSTARLGHHPVHESHRRRLLHAAGPGGGGVRRRRRSVLRMCSASAQVDLDPKLQEIAARGLQLPTHEPALVAGAVGELRARMGSEAEAATDAELAWFLKARNLEVEEAQEYITRYLEWRASGYTNLSYLDPSIAKEKATGKAYLRDECDVLGRPVVVVNVPLQVVAERELEATQKLCVCLMDEALERMEAADQGAETVLVIFDLRGFGMDNADIPFLLFFVDVIFKYFPKRVSQVLLIEPPFIFNPVWQVVKPLLGKYASLVRKAKVAELPEYLGAGFTQL